MKAVICTALVALACLATPAFAEDDPVGLFKNVTGRVAIDRNGATLDAKPGMAVFVADRLRADASASAGIVFRDGTLLTLGSRADLQVRDYVFKPNEAKYAFSAYLAKGSAIYSSGKIGKLSPETVKVDTPTATIGVRGTRFVVEAD